MQSDSVAPRASLTVLVDENLSLRLASFIGNRGHVVQIVEAGTYDSDIVADADVLGAIVVTSDRDFLRWLTRNPARDSGKYPRAGLIVVSGDESMALPRFEQLIDLIEFLYATLQTTTDPRLIMHVRERTIWIDL